MKPFWCRIPKGLVSRKCSLLKQEVNTFYRLSTYFTYYKRVGEVWGWGRKSCCEPNNSKNRETNHPPSLMQISRTVRRRTSCQQMDHQLFWVFFVHQMQLWFARDCWAGHMCRCLWCNRYCLRRKYVNVKIYLSKGAKTETFFLCAKLLWYFCNSTDYPLWLCEVQDNSLLPWRAL